MVASIASDCHPYIYPGKTLMDFLLFDLDFFALALTWGRYTCLRAMIRYRHDTNEHSTISSFCHGIRGLIAENTVYNVPLYQPTCAQPHFPTYHDISRGLGVYRQRGTIELFTR